MGRLTSFDVEDILFGLLSGSEELKAELSGGIYVGERPDGSMKEDIAINTLTLNRDMPQSGTSNVNIHVPDLLLTVDGKQQYKTDRERLRTLAEKAIAVLEAAVVDGLSFWISNEAIIREPDINQSYDNLRVEWYIARTD